MTVKELSQLYWLNREIEEDKRRLDELENITVSPRSPKYDGMPHEFGHSDTLAHCVAEILDLKARIAAKQTQCIHERIRLEQYISSIPDSLTRQIFSLRFISGMNWQQTAMHVGGGNTEDSVRQRVYRYLKNTQS